MAKYIYPQLDVYKNAQYRFLKETSLKEMTVKIFALTRFKLYVNDVYVCEGPCQNSEFEYAYEKVDISKYLSRENNEIRVDVMHIADFSFIAAFSHKTPVFWFEGEKDGEVVLQSDLSWKVLKRNDIEYFQGEGVMNTTGPFEKHSGVADFTEMQVCEGDVLSTNRLTRNNFGFPCVFPLVENSLPQMYTGDWQDFKVDKNTENGFVLDAGRYTTAKIRLKVNGKKGDTVKITYSECYEKPNLDGFWVPEKGLRDDNSGCLSGPSDYITLSGDVQEIEFWWYRAFRYVSVSCESMDKTNIEIQFAEYFYPYPITAEFSCSNETYNKIWETSIRTLLCCSHEIVVDCPFFEQQQYCMDSFLEATFALRLCNDTRMPKKIIRNLAHSQLQDGFVQANYPSRDKHVIPTFSVYWLMLLESYWYYSDDSEFVKQYIGVTDKMLSAFENCLDQNGLVGATDYWNFVDWAGDWQHGVPNGGIENPLAVYSMQYSYGLKSAAKLALALGYKAKADDYNERREKLNKNIKKYFYNEQVGYYNNALNVEEFSQHTAVWAILAEIETGEKAVELFNKMNEVSTAVCSFSFGFFLFRAYEKLGIYNEAFKHFDSFKMMLDLHCTTWCENPDRPRSECHAWSSTPIYEFSNNILGVKQIEKGFKKVRISPEVGELSFAKGKVPTPFGDINVAWEIKDGEIFVHYTAPTQIKVELYEKLKLK